MKLQEETVNYQNPMLRLKVWERIATYNASPPRIPAGKKPVTWHYHKEVELLLVLEGHIEVFIAEKRWILGPGDVAILGSNEPHCTRPLGPVLKEIVLQADLKAFFDQTTMIHSRYLQERLHPLSSLNYIVEDNIEAKAHIAECIKDIYRESQLHETGYEFAISSSMKKMLLTLVRHDKRNVLGYGQDERYDFLDPVMAYVDNHYHEKISVDEASRLMNISYRHFLRTFRKATGMSFIDYVNQKRMRAAVKYFLTDDCSIETIASKVGISNLSHFYHLFKKQYGCSPRRYRKHLLNIIADPNDSGQ